jgi:hypothetical protein
VKVEAFKAVQFSAAIFGHCRLPARVYSRRDLQIAKLHAATTDADFNVRNPDFAKRKSMDKTKRQETSGVYIAGIMGKYKYDVMIVSPTL